MQFRVVHRHAAIPPRKARYVIDLVRGQDVNRAFEILAFTRKHATFHVKKLLDSAVANASQAPGINVNKLFIAEARVDGGPILPARFLTGPMGRALPVRRRTSHIHLVLSERGVEAVLSPEKVSKEVKGKKTVTTKSTEKAPEGANKNSETKAKKVSTKKGKS